MVRIDQPAGGYAHHTGISGVLVEVSGKDQQIANQIAMHVAAMRPKAVSKEELDPALIEKEREILSEAARKEGKPENIIAKMVEGRLRNYFQETVLNEQLFVKDDSKTVGKLAQESGMKILRFVHWQLGKDEE
jgi:elongation factor Ts